MDQFLISGASDYGQYYCHGEDSCRTAVFIYRNVSFFGPLCRWGGGKGLSQVIAALQSLGCPHRVQPLHARLQQPYTIKAAGAVCFHRPFPEWMWACPERRVLHLHK